MSTYNNLGTVEMWRSKKSALDVGKPTSLQSKLVDYDNNYLKKMNNLHGQFMNKTDAQIDAAEQILKNANQNYDTLMSGVDTVIALVERSESNGNVDSVSSDAYNVKTTASSNLGSSMLNDNPERNMGNDVSGVSSSLSSSSIGTPATAAAATVGAVSSSLSSSVLNNQAISSSSSVNVTSYEFGSYNISDNCWSSLSRNEQVNVVGKLSSVGYSENEINEIINGNVSVSNLEVVALSTSLQDGLARYPELRQDLNNRYSFDIFNEDGTVDNDKLSLALLIDDKDAEDEYSLIEYLHSKYGIDIVDQNKYNAAYQLLEDLGDKFEQIRAELVARYGFDIFNRDKTVNRDRLTLALLIDEKNKTDEFDLIEFLKKVYEKEENVIVKSSVVKTLYDVENENNLESLSTTNDNNEEIEKVLELKVDGNGEEFSE